MLFRSQQELLLSIKEAKKGKSPGLDGLSVEFYTTFFQEIKTLSLAAINFLYKNGITNTKIAEGAITLIHKKRRQKENKQRKTHNTLEHRLQNIK